MRPFPIPAVRIALCVLFVAATGCDDTVIDPFDNDGRFFSVYGYLDVLQTDHVVRVVPVMRTPERILDPSDPQAQIDATVTSTDLSTGQTVRWRHSLERLADGTYGHLFRASFLVQPGRTYRLEVTRNDGARSTAETKVPSVSDATLFELAPLTVSADSTVVTQEVVIPGVASPWHIEAVYLMSNRARDEGTLNGRFFVPYGRRGERTAGGDWRFTLTISEDQAYVKEAIAEYRRQGVYDSSFVSMDAMGIQIRLLDNAWDPPEGVFDPEVLAQPGRLSNVANGYGFWGSIGLYRQEWIVSPDFSRMVGYTGF